MFDVITNYFTNDWQLLILVSVACASLTSGVLSPIVVSSRMAFFSDAVAHSTLAGVALGLLLSLNNPITLMVGVAVVVALIIASLRQVTTLGLDTLLGVAMAGSLAVGLLMYHVAQSGYVGLHSYLFGQVSLLGPTDMWALIFNAVIAIVVGALWGNRFLLLAVSRPLAQARGIPVARYEFLLIVLLGLVVSLSVRAVGLLLVNALLIVPAATSRNLARSVRGMFWGSVVVALFSGLTGLFVADYLKLPPAPTIVVVAVILFFVSQALRPLLGHQSTEN
ncbi:MAG: metal ABC transporter permease [Planctomycetes bacterium]|nr:metal ABC transporter permease [Planctomycetota bacterium]MCA8946763.1 metal ABC transporter permease [Planctomycetota bacterium]